MVQIRKYPDCSCSLCSLPEKTDVPAGWIPHPVFDNVTRHYTHFTTMVNDSTGPEVCCPSLNGMGKKETYKQSVKCTKQNLRMITRYSNCSKPRGIYSSKKIATVHINDLLEYIDDYQYVCGELIFPMNTIDKTDLTLGDATIEANHKVTCQNNMEVALDENKMGQIFCVYCGGEDIIQARTDGGPICCSCSSIRLPIEKGRWKANTDNALFQAVRTKRKLDMSNTIQNTKVNPLTLDYLLESLHLEAREVPGIGDCQLHSVLGSQFNMRRSMKSDDYLVATEFKRSMINMAFKKPELGTNQDKKMIMIRNQKLSMKRMYSVGDKVPPPLWNSIDDIALMVYLLNKPIVVISMEQNGNVKSVDLHILVDKTYQLSKRSRMPAEDIKAKRLIHHYLAKIQDGKLFYNLKSNSPAVEYDGFIEKLHSNEICVIIQFIVKIVLPQMIS